MNQGPGEFELIAAIRERIEREAAAIGSTGPPGLVLGGGDDAAISVPQGATATSVDALVEGIHFRIPPFEHRSVGHKALAAALSDLAAMGARAGEAYIQLGVPERIDEPELLEIAAGLGALAAAHGVAIAGGDVTRSPALLLAVTVVGHSARSEQLVRRSGAEAGEALVVTGELGGAAAGLALLDHPGLAEGLPDAVSVALQRRQLEPEPRLDAGAALAAAGATAMIDLSDGLGGDARQLAAASGVLLRLDAPRLPIQAGVEEVAAAAGSELLDLALGGGEDYELLAALPRGRIDAAVEAVAACGIALSVVGSVELGDGVLISSPGGEVPPPAGFDQLG